MREEAETLGSTPKRKVWQTVTFPVWCDGAHSENTA